MRFRFNCWLIALGFLCGLVLICKIAQGDTLVVSGSWAERDCHQEWAMWALNATSRLSGPTTSLATPIGQTVIDNTVGKSMFYMAAHSDHYISWPGCDMIDPWKDELRADAFNIEKPFDFAFIAGCGALCRTGFGTFANIAIDAVGYCGMAEPQCAGCWSANALSFQDFMFMEMADGRPVGEAHQAASNKFPECRGCIRYSHHDTPIPTLEKNQIVMTIIVPWLMRKR